MGTLFYSADTQPIQIDDRLLVDHNTQFRPRTAISCKIIYLRALTKPAAPSRAIVRSWRGPD